MTLLDDAVALRRMAGLEVDDAIVARIQQRIENSDASQLADWRNGVRKSRDFLNRQPVRAA